MDEGSGGQLNAIYIVGAYVATPVFGHGSSAWSLTTCPGAPTACSFLVKVSLSWLAMNAPTVVWGVEVWASTVPGLQGTNPIADVAISDDAIFVVGGARTDVRSGGFHLFASSPDDASAFLYKFSGLSDAPGPQSSWGKRFLHADGSVINRILPRRSAIGNLIFAAHTLPSVISGGSFEFGGIPLPTCSGVMCGFVGEITGSGGVLWVDTAEAGVATGLNPYTSAITIAANMDETVLHSAGTFRGSLLFKHAGGSGVWRNTSDAGSAQDVYVTFTAMPSSPPASPPLPALPPMPPLPPPFLPPPPLEFWPVQVTASIGVVLV